VDWDDLHRWAMINKALDLGIPEPQETYSSSPHLRAELDIPEGTTGTLPRSARTRAGLEAERVEDLGETGRSGGSGGRDSGRRGGGRRGEAPGRRSESGRGDGGRGEGRTPVARTETGRGEGTPGRRRRR